MLTSLVDDFHGVCIKNPVLTDTIVELQNDVKNETNIRLSLENENLDLKEKVSSLTADLEKEKNLKEVVSLHVPKLENEIDNLRKTIILIQETKCQGATPSESLVNHVDKLKKDLNKTRKQNLRLQEKLDAKTETIRNVVGNKYSAVPFDYSTVPSSKTKHGLGYDPHSI
ncbi:hypothetical protein Dimus_039014 [Dionaea muscipula]